MVFAESDRAEEESEMNLSSSVLPLANLLPTCHVATQLLIVWVTNRCTLRCKGCYMSAGDIPGRDLDPDLFAQALDNLSFVKGGSVQIAGGEPSLVPDIVEEVARQALAAGSYRLSLQTNGQGVDDAFLDLMERYQISVGLSIDGTPRINEHLRGGTQKTLQALELMDARGIPVSITTVVSRHNVEDLPKLGALLTRYNCVQSIGLDLVRPSGRANEDWLPDVRTLKRSYQSLADMLDWANLRRKMPIKIREASYVGSKKKQLAYCAAEVGQSAVLTPDGTLYPCSTCVGDPDYACGTAAQPDFSNLEMGMQAETNSCNTCKIAGCRGRCPSRTRLSNKAGALDCALRHAAWSRNTKSINSDKQ